MTDHPAILPPSDMPPSSGTALGKEGSRVSGEKLPKSAIPVTSELLALAREGNQNRVLTQYVWGARPGHRDELVLRDRASTGSGELDERLYSLMDYFDPTSAVDTEGEVVERYGFSAFGVREVMAPDWTPRAESWFEWEFGFHGQFLDTETGYYNYGFRYYMPEMGRLVSRDPIEEQGGLNLYGFVGNDGVGAVDRLGLEFKCCGGSESPGTAVNSDGSVTVRLHPVPYNTEIQCCVDGEVFDRRPSPTGISIVYVIPGGWNPGNHAGLQGPYWGPRGVQRAPDQDFDAMWTNDPQLKRDKNTSPVKLSGCDYDIEKFRRCVANATTVGKDVDFNFCSNNCRKHVNTVIEECKNEAKR